MATKTIKVDYLARVEGEGAFNVTVRNGKVQKAELVIFEPPRFFESFLRGRQYSEAPDITARICGICPIAYQMSSIEAMEAILGVKVDGPLRELRRLIYCGEWIESHVLHIYMLHAPDFLGYQGAIDMAKDHGEAVKRGLALKKLGNEIMEVVGGREIHPINMRVGGFYRVPRKHDLLALVDRLKWARDAAIETLRWVSAFEFPERSRDYEFVSLRHASEYPIIEGRIVSNRGLDIDVAQYEDHFQEVHVEHSTALHSRRLGAGSYLVGPLARYNLNFDRLSAVARQAAREVGMGPRCTNPYRSIQVRAVETIYAFDEALRIIENYQEPERPFVPAEIRPGIGMAGTEAPRGLCWHRYRIDEQGSITEAKIVPPTSQNQPSIEEDLREYVGGWLDLPDEELKHRCEQTIRNYDPCISCSVHFLRLDIDRG